MLLPRKGATTKTNSIAAKGNTDGIRNIANTDFK